MIEAQYMSWGIKSDFSIYKGIKLGCIIYILRSLDLFLVGNGNDFKQGS